MRQVGKKEGNKIFFLNISGGTINHPLWVLKSKKKPLRSSFFIKHLQWTQLQSLQENLTSFLPTDKGTVSLSHSNLHTIVDWNPNSSSSRERNVMQIWVGREADFSLCSSRGPGWSHKQDFSMTSSTSTALASSWVGSLGLKSQI